MQQCKALQSFPVQKRVELRPGTPHNPSELWCSDEIDVFPALVAMEILLWLAWKPVVLVFKGRLLEVAECSMLHTNKALNITLFPESRLQKLVYRNCCMAKAIYHTHSMSGFFYVMELQNFFFYYYYWSLSKCLKTVRWVILL